MTYQIFKILAEGYMAQIKYRQELDEQIMGTAKKYHVETDFLGLPDGCPAQDAIGEAIKSFDTYETFSYFFYDCDSNWNKFNRAISWEKDGKTYHPDCHSLHDLWRYINYENSPKKVMQNPPIKAK